MREELGAEFYDELHYPDGRVVKRAPVHNVLNTQFNVLKAKTVTGKDATPIRYLDVGTGDPAWDSAPPPPTPSTTEAGLLAPLARSNLLTGADWEYMVTPPTSPESVSGVPTSRVKMSTSFSVGVANGNIREAALFGGAAATGTLSSGDLVNVLRHTVIQKPAGASDFTLVRILIIQFVVALFVLGRMAVGA